IIESYLPARMGIAEVEAAVQRILAGIGANGMADMGRAMKSVNAELAGKADGGTIAAAVKKILSGG
ncbi:MAG TPA: GatB/YqeY domain-containing protein, partial [Flavobacteriales bacterium]|nr:GatB/YqeY domain-containing protein [Flavobacteriales bacterium]